MFIRYFELGLLVRRGDEASLGRAARGGVTTQSADRTRGVYSRPGGVYRLLVFS